MKILYVASGITLPGSYGGATHTLEVAHGLAQRGHELHVVVRQAAGQQLPALPGVTFHALNLPKQLGLLGLAPLLKLARRLRPDALMERYYNFAGAGIAAAHLLDIPTLLEVNALIVDPPQVLKRRLDDRMGAPLRRWAVRQCRWSDVIVTPLHTTVPAEVPRERIVELPWGAPVERFALQGRERESSRAAIRQRHGIPAGRPVAVFLGSFRAWHGVGIAVEAAVQLLERGHDLQLLLIGDGPERAAAEVRAARWRSHITFAGSVPHAEVPGYLAAADVGLAPFDRAAHPALQAAGFFWSPLKMYEYMAAGLPVIASAIPPLEHVIRPGVEGLLAREGQPASLAAAIAQLLALPAPERATLGASARRRVAAHFSWAQHCADLERLLAQIQRPKTAQPL